MRPKHGELPASNPQPSPEADARSVYPLTLHHNGRMGGAYVLFAESAQIRSEWKEKLEHAIGLRKVVQESNKAFEVETLSSDTFLMPLYANTAQGPAWEQGNTFTGRVTCSVPFSENLNGACVSHTDTKYSSYSRQSPSRCSWMPRGCMDWLSS